jgi:hypothetical protein
VKPVVIVAVKSTKEQWFVTRNNPETRQRTLTNYDECKLKCGHYEYRRLWGTKATHLACAACTGRDLTAAELKRRSER